MKKMAIMIAIMLLQTQITVGAATVNQNYKKQPAQQTQQVRTTQPATKQQSRPANNADYLLKYNINDLEAAPWLNGGKRKI